MERAERPEWFGHKGEQAGEYRDDSACAGSGTYVPATSPRGRLHDAHVDNIHPFHRRAAEPFAAYAVRLTRHHVEPRVCWLARHEPVAVPT